MITNDVERPRIVLNQVKVNETRAMRSADELIRAMRELPLRSQNDVLHYLVGRIEDGYADPRYTP